jgi:hypothetical protein
MKDHEYEMAGKLDAIAGREPKQPANKYYRAAYNAAVSRMPGGKLKPIQ